MNLSTFFDKVFFYFFIIGLFFLLFSLIEYVFKRLQYKKFNKTFFTKTKEERFKFLTTELRKKIGSIEDILWITKPSSSDTFRSSFILLILDFIVFFVVRSVSELISRQGAPPTLNLILPFFTFGMIFLIHDSIKNATKKWYILTKNDVVITQINQVEKIPFNNLPLLAKKNHKDGSVSIIFDIESKIVETRNEKRLVKTKKAFSHISIEEGNEIHKIISKIREKIVESEEKIGRVSKKENQNEIENIKEKEKEEEKTIHKRK
ncbi:hypothetical protein M0811_02526 [Anaeramoeba ignava]|uniref:Uncharacterized protein n=1 Tax=Anaeramoeba ignava TaxID=1746090 RepID=A0A9Q0LA38_ANAIG|nr:hypothetical protein M0811_02526 [Anaeramoeba ignava]